MKRTSRQSQVGGIRPHDRDRRMSEPLAKLLHAAWVQLDGDDPSAGADQRRGERAGAGADVDDDVTWSDGGVVDEQLRPVVSELMPAPTCPLVRGHDAP